MKAIITLAAVSLILSGCGKGVSHDDSTGTNQPAAVNNPTDSSNDPVSLPEQVPMIGDSCGANMLQSQNGCLPQCGIGSVLYQNQCIPIAQGAGTYGQYTPIGSAGSAQMCQGNCPDGLVSIGGQCLPQGSCGPCYGQYGQSCYIGDYAHQYYGY